MVVPLLEVLDLCDTTRSSAKRLTTTVAPQALSMFNGDFVNRQAKHLADRLAREAGDNSQDQIDLAYRLLLCRAPSMQETLELTDFIVRETQEKADPVPRDRQGLTAARVRKEALEQACRVLLNLNEVVYPD